MSEKLKLIHPMCVPGDRTKIRLLAYGFVDASVITRWAIVDITKPWAKPLRKAFAQHVDVQTLKTLLRNKQAIVRRMGSEWGASLWVGPAGVKPHFVEPA